MDIQDLQQNTALHLSPTPTSLTSESEEGHRSRALTSMTVLLEGNCFVNLFNRDSETALHRAVESRSIEAVTILLKHGAVVHPEIIRDTCLLLKDDRILKILLASDSSLHDDFLLTILIALIVSETSCWMFNNESHQNQLHLSAKYLIQRIKDINSVDTFLHHMRPAEIETMFGEDFANQFKQSGRSDLMLFGLFGLALRYGKYGVAWMLYLAGCDITLMRLIKDTEVGNYLKVHPYLSPWVRGALTTPTSLKILARVECRAKGLTGSKLPQKYPQSIRDYLDLTDLDNIKPFDATVREVGEAILDQSYVDREKAKAARQQILWLYS